MEEQQPVRRRTIPLPRVLVTIGAVVVAMGLVLAGIQGWQSYTAAQDRQAVDRFTTTIAPSAKAAGQLVSQQINPELQAYIDGRVSGSKLAADAKLWAQVFEGTRRAFHDAPRPARLDSTESLFERSLTQYRDAVLLIATEAEQQGADPATAIQPGIVAFSEANGSYDTAEAQFVCVRRSQGLGATREFPATHPC